MQIFRVLKKFGSVLSNHQKKRIFQIVVLMIIGGLLETCSVSLIFPFMNIVMNPEEYMNNKVVIFLCQILHIDSSRDFLVVLSVLLAGLYLAKNVYLLFEYNVQYKFVYANMFSMQERLLSNFIHRPYEYFLGINSGEIVRIINTDTPAVFNMLITILGLFTEIVVSGMLVIAVFIVAPLVTLIIAVVLLIMVCIINCIVRPILRNAGRMTQKSSAGMNKWLLQSIQGIKELKVMSKETFFEKNFNEFGKDYVVSLRRYNISTIIPRFFIEAISMSTMFIIVGILIYGGTSLEILVPVLSAVALAAIRLLPSVNRISMGLGSVSYNEPMLDKLIENLKDIEKNNGVYVSQSRKSTVKENKISDFKDEIILQDITYKYPENNTPILINTSLVIKKGQSIGIVGASGAGKTTTVDIMLGFLNPQAGKVLIDGKDISNDMPDFLRQVGYIPQSIFILDDSIRANIAFGEDDISDEAVWKAVKEASLYDFVKGLPEGLDTQIGERGVRLSGGQRQRVGIARALYHNPAILVLDEATSSLDNETERSIMESIDYLIGQKTIIIIAHRLTTIEKCDYIYMVEDGKIRIKN